MVNSNSVLSQSTVCDFYDDSLVYVIKKTQENTNVTEAKQETGLKDLNCIKRQLIYECHAIFCKTQTVAIANNALFRLEEAEVLSQRYRLAIQKALNALEYSDCTVDEKEETGNNLMSAQIIWSLFEAVFIRPTDNSIVVDLIEWGRECVFPPSTDILAAVIDEISNYETKEKPESHQLFWNALFQQVLCGKFKAASKLLQYHSKHSSDIAFQKIVRILQKIEIGLSSNRKSCEEFTETQNEIRLLRSGLSSQYHDLKFLCSILLGEQATFEQCSFTFTMKWYELLPSYLLFAHPMAKTKQVGGIAKKFFMFIEKNKTEENSDLLDKILFAILQLDCLEALKLICSAGSNLWWLATHLVDLLFYHNAEVLTVSKNPTPEDLDLRTRIVTKYANLLFATDRMWEIAADYLIASGSENAAQLLNQRMLELDWKDNTQLAEQFIATCDKYELLSAKSEITRAVTIKFLKDKEYSTALCWSLRNGNAELIAHVAQKILYYSDPNDIAQMRIFDAVSESFLITAELMILWKFYNYKRLILEGNLKEAIIILHDLLVDNSAPDGFFVTLLNEMLRLMNTFNEGQFLSSANFDKNAILNLMEALSKFEFFYNIRNSGKLTLEQEKTNENIYELLTILQPTLLSALATSFFTLNE